MPQCFVSSCSNYYNKTRGDPSVIYHTFPASPTRARKWVEVCGGGKEQHRPNFARICSAHFSPKCYRRDLQHELLGLPLRKKLKPDAVPDINLPSQTSAVRVVDNKGRSGNGENVKISKHNSKFPMRSSIRIAKKRSIETCRAVPGRRVLQNSTNKINFMAKLDLKKEKNVQGANKTAAKTSTVIAADVISSERNVDR